MKLLRPGASDRNPCAISASDDRWSQVNVVNLVYTPEELAVQSLFVFAVCTAKSNDEKRETARREKLDRIACCDQRFEIHCHVDQMAQVLLEAFDAVASQHEIYFERPKPSPKRQLPVAIVHHKTSIRVLVSQKRRRNVESFGQQSTVSYPVRAQRQSTVPSSTR